jgi:anti-anti-sigma factor
MTNILCRVEIERVDGYPVARLFGEIDASNVEHIERELETLAAGSEPMCVVDLTEAEYFDSAGIRLLFSLAMRLRTRRQELHVIVPESSTVRRVLEITDFSRFVPVHASLEALSRLEEH